MSRQEGLSEESGRQALADLEASSRLCLAALPALGREGEALASQAHSLLLEAQLAEREPYVTIRLSARDARQAALALTAEQVDLEQLAGPGTERAARALQAAGWQPGAHPAPSLPNAEELAEQEAEQLATRLTADRRRSGQEGVPADWLGLAPGEREALRWLSQGEEEGAEELPDDYVMEVQQAVSSAVERLAGRLEELYGNRPEGAPGRAALGERLGLGYESWRRIAAAALADDLEPALGSLPLGGEGEIIE